MTNETHPVRRAGQTWAYDFDGIETSVHARRFVLTEVRESTWYATDEEGRGSCFASEREFKELPHMFRLVSDAPATCKAPDDYVECDKKCGRWTWATSNMARICWGCHKVHRDSAEGRANEAAHPDWSPPLAAAPVTSGPFAPCRYKCGGGDGHGSSARCPGKPTTNDLGTGAPITSGNVGSASPAPTAPVPVTCTCPDDDQPGHMSDCPMFERGFVVTGIDWGCSGCHQPTCTGMYTRCRDSACLGELLDSALDRDVPDRIPRPRMAHVGHDDSIGEDV